MALARVVGESLLVPLVVAARPGDQVGAYVPGGAGDDDARWQEILLSLAWRTAVSISARPAGVK